MPDAIADVIENRKIKNRNKSKKLKNRKKPDLKTGDNFSENEWLEKRTTKAKRCKSLLEGRFCR